MAVLFAVSALFSETQESPDNQNSAQALNQDLIVTKISFTGLKKTRNSYIQSKVKKFTGKPLAETDIHDLETALQLEGIFNEINITPEQISESEAQISVSVKEKITFIPLPFAIYSSSGLIAGGVVMDTNALGEKDMFMIGGFLGPITKTALAVLSANPKENGIPGFSLFLSGSKSEPEYTDLSNDLVLKYNDASFQTSLTLTEAITDGFSFTNGFSFEIHQIDDNNRFKNLAPESLKNTSMSVGFNYSKSDWNGIFLSTNTASVSAAIGLTDSKDSDYRYPMGFSFSISEQHPIFSGRLRISQKYSGYYGIKNHWSAFKNQSAASVTLLSSHFSSQRLVGGNAGLEYAVKKFSWGMVSVYGDYQFMISQDFNPLSDDKSYHFIHGPDGGFRFYLAKIAFPAFAMGLTYNITKSTYQFSAALGMTF